MATDRISTSTRSRSPPADRQASSSCPSILPPAWMATTCSSSSPTSHSADRSEAYATIGHSRPLLQYSCTSSCWQSFDTWIRLSFSDLQGHLLLGNLRHWSWIPSLNAGPFTSTPPISSWPLKLHKDTNYSINRTTASWTSSTGTSTNIAMHILLETPRLPILTPPILVWSFALRVFHVDIRSSPTLRSSWQTLQSDIVSETLPLSLNRKKGQHRIGSLSQSSLQPFFGDPYTVTDIVSLDILPFRDLLGQNQFRHSSRWSFYWASPSPRIHFTPVPLHPDLPHPEHLNVRFGQPVSAIPGHTSILQACWGLKVPQHPCSGCQRAKHHQHHPRDQLFGIRPLFLRFRLLPPHLNLFLLGPWWAAMQTCPTPAYNPLDALD